MLEVRLEVKRKAGQKQGVSTEEQVIMDLL